MKRLLDAAQKASTDLALFMTADLRKQAAANGWDHDVVKTLRVAKKDDTFAVKFPTKTGDAAFVHEYGDPDNTPSSVIRKYDNTHPAAESFFEERFLKHMGGTD
jgi:hypothetical protein